MSRSPRIGIITIHDVPNYGAFLQAWSLSKAIRSLGHDVEIVDYRPAAAKAFYDEIESKSRASLLKRFANYRFGRFARRNLALGPTCQSLDDLKQLTGRYDTLVCGSDQVWHTKSFRGFDEAYFLSWAGPSVERRVAYAPSCSGLDDFSPQDDRVREMLGHFTALSARDDNTLSLVRGLGVENIERVVDPTLLVDCNDLARDAGRRRPYLLVYGGIKPWAREPIRRIANDNNLTLINIGGRLKEADRNHPFVLPDKWIGFFRGASAVVTSAFHGVMFAMKFQRPFLAVPSKGKEAKISDALAAYGLSDRLVGEAPEGIEQLTAERLMQGYDVSDRLDPLVASSWDYLRRALDGKR